MVGVLDAIAARRSCRAFLDKPIDEQVLKKIFRSALHAPSNKNTQHWQVAILTGKTKKQLSEALITCDQQGQAVNPDFSHLGKTIPEEYWARAKACGVALYEALGIKRDDHERRQAQWQLNYKFFNAPVGLIFYIDKSLPEACLFDAGIFLSHVMLAAQAYGVASCPQMSMGNYPDVVRKHLKLSDDKAIICGMALGYADNTHSVNQYRTDRESLDAFLQWFS